MTTEQEPWQWGNRIRGGNIRTQVRERLLREYDDELTAKHLKVEILRFAAPEYESPPTQEQQLAIAAYEAAEDCRSIITIEQPCVRSGVGK